MGAIAGFLAGLASERFKVGVAALDKEFDRLDALHDNALEILSIAKARGEVAAELRRLERERGRLGQNLKRLLGRRRGWNDIATALAQFSTLITAVSDAADNPPGPGDLPDRITVRAQALRGVVRKAAREHLVWQALRP